MIATSENQCLGRVVNGRSRRGVFPAGSGRFVGARVLLCAVLFGAGAGGEFNAALAQMGFAHDPICGPGYRFGIRSAAARAAARLSENGVTNQVPQGFEYDVKAALLFRCVELARWPAGAEVSKERTLTIGLLGENPFWDSFERLAGKTVSGRRLVVKQLSGVRKAAGCQLVFIGASEQKRTAMILEKLAGLPVLTVGETPGFTEQGGMIGLRLEGKHVRLEANPAAAEKAGIMLNAGLQIPGLLNRY